MGSDGGRGFRGRSIGSGWRVGEVDPGDSADETSMVSGRSGSVEPPMMARPSRKTVRSTGSPDSPSTP